MSEQSPETQPTPENPKIPKLFDDCNVCEKRYIMTPENTRGYHFNKQEECDYLYAICDHCENNIRIFVNSHTMEVAILNDIPIEDKDYADENTYDSWIGLVGVELVKPVELTDRHEALIHKFGEIILNMPPEFFWDNIEADTGKPYTERWL